jgi:CRISPR-associated protein Csy1
MHDTDHQRIADLRAVTADFLKKRLDDKLDKIKDTEDKADEKRAELRQQYEPSTWLEDAARRVSQIQAVTHSLKPIHPDAKGTNLYAPPDALSVLDAVGSHCLGADFAGDVVGNAAALDVYKFLKLKHQGCSLLDLVLARDTDLAAAFSSDPDEASAWMDAFAGLTEARGKLASHTQAKQLYWLVGDDPHDDSQYHLLAPLYASSLAHRVWQQIQDDRFSEEAKAARKARHDGEWSDRPVREYPQLAIQQLGGTKPQNISQLNSERRGNNYLLASLPPVWRSTGLKPLHGTDSMLHRYSRREQVRQTVRTLVEFLKTDPTPNAETRAHRAALVDVLIDELLQFSAEIRTLPAGWSQSPDCDLNGAEKHWLDPDGVAQAGANTGRPLPTDTAERISHAFANWLNAQLRDTRSRTPLPVGDDEFLVWRKRMLEDIEADERGARDDD